MKLTLPYPPTVNTYWRRHGHIMYTSAKGQAYKQRCAIIARGAGVEPILGPVRIRMTVYRPRKCGDLDNTLKATLDSLKGIAYADDSQIVHIDARRLDDKANPRAEVEIEPA